MAIDHTELRQFHTARQNSSVAVTIEKSTAPMLWLDTSVFIDLARAKDGERTEPTRQKKLERLYAIARRAIRNERIVCPEWDQSDETEGKPLADRIQRLISDLSCGAHCATYGLLKDRQASIGMRAYIGSDSSIRIPAKIHFSQDPLEAIRWAKKHNLIIEADIPTPQAWIDKADLNKAMLLAGLEKSRLQHVKERRTFEQQLELERRAEATGVLRMYDDLCKRASDAVDAWTRLGVIGFEQAAKEYKEIGGPGEDFTERLIGVYAFMNSPYYWQLPIQDVACRLSADIIVQKHEIGLGDNQDIQHLSTAIPVAHFVVTDNAMFDRCRRLKLGDKWNTKIYATRTLDDLSDEIAAL